jgi:SAM-dependent methyltransferase
VTDPPWDPPYLEHLARLGATDLHPGGRRGSARLERALAIGPGQRVLEIGCGTGATLIRLASSYPVQLYGIDRMGRMLETAKRRLALAGLASQVSLARADAARLPFPDGAFDRVYMESVLGFQPPERAGAFLEEVRRVLRSAGRFVANEAVWKEGTSRATVSSIHESSVGDFGLAQATAAGWTVSDWTRCMQVSGFAVRASEPLGSDGHAEPADGRRCRTGLRRLRALAASRSLSLAYRARASLSPELSREKREYRSRLARHRDDGRHIEAYLFVLEHGGGGP